MRICLNKFQNKILLQLSDIGSLFSLWDIITLSCSRWYPGLLVPLHLLSLIPFPSSKNESLSQDLIFGGCLQLICMYFRTSAKCMFEGRCIIGFVILLYGFSHLFTSVFDLPMHQGYPLGG